MNKLGSSKGRITLGKKEGQEGKVSGMILRSSLEMCCTLLYPSELIKRDTCADEGGSGKLGEMIISLLAKINIHLHF